MDWWSVRSGSSRRSTNHQPESDYEERKREKGILKWSRDCWSINLLLCQCLRNIQSHQLVFMSCSCGRRESARETHVRIGILRFYLENSILHGRWMSQLGDTLVFIHIYFYFYSLHNHCSAEETEDGDWIYFLHSLSVSSGICNDLLLFSESVCSLRIHFNLQLQDASLLQF